MLRPFKEEKMERVKIFHENGNNGSSRCDERLEKRINEWYEKNPNVSVTAREMRISNSGDYINIVIMISYETVLEIPD